MKAEFGFVDQNRRGKFGLQQQRGEARESQRAVRNLIRPEPVIGILLSPFETDRILIPGIRRQHEVTEEWKYPLDRGTNQRIMLRMRGLQPVQERCQVFRQRPQEFAVMDISRL